jgi:aerobic-type carbon monoxide dehydrogenase small subunit (CoxS/CutS family)
MNDGTFATEDSVTTRRIQVTVNGDARQAECPDRTLLVDFLRHNLGLKGTHVGCMNGDCGACTVLVNGEAFKSCLVLAPAVEGAEITTVEGLGCPGRLHPIQEAFWDKDGFQCGFCLPGHLFAALKLLEETPRPTGGEIREALSGNLCRCTGYEKIVESVKVASALMANDTSET